MVHDQAATKPTPASGAHDVRLYTLEEVHAKTGLSLRKLQDGARADRFEHCHFGGKRYMTADQIDKMIADAVRAAAAADDEIAKEVARRANRNRAPKQRATATRRAAA